MAITQTGTINNVHYAVRGGHIPTLTTAVRLLTDALKAMNAKYIEDIHKGSNLNTIYGIMDMVPQIKRGTEFSWGLGDTEADALAKL